jgi:hypothetical protein
MYVLKQKNNLTTANFNSLDNYSTYCVFILGIFMKLDKLFTLILMILLHCLMFIILRNAFEIDRKQNYSALNFNLI